MWEDDEGEYAGVGILISSNYATGICKISRVFKGSPAEAAGVQRGDILYRVGEDLYVVPETLQDAVDIMRGTPGTTVDVTFLRNGEEITFTMERAVINVNQTESKMLTDTIGMIAMYEFSGKSDEEFEKALDSLNVLSALMTWALEGGVITADSMKARGYGTEKRSSFRMQKMKSSDIILLSVMAVLAAAIVRLIAGGGTAADYTPIMRITPVTGEHLAGFAAYCVFLSLPTVLYIKEVVQWRISRSGI